MKSTLRKLDDVMGELYEQDSTFSRSGLDHGSPDQTRAILFESIMKAAINNVQAAIDQIKILDKHLY